jgi:hypothetical protein
MSKEMLEAAYRGVLDRQVLEALDEPWDVQCESQFHDEGGSATTKHSGPAAFWQHGQCEHSTGFRCAASVASLKRYKSAGCRTCGARAAIEDLSWTPLVADHD